jgi:hypothetical protein
MANTATVEQTKIEAAAEVAPVAPAAPVAVFNAEEAIAALAAKFETLSQQFAALVTSKLEAAVVEEAPAAEEPAIEPAPAAPEAKVEEIAAEAPADNTAAALKAEVATMKIELEASRGTKPLETAVPQNFSRAELIAQFNAEKDPRRAAEIFNKIKLAR